MRKKEKVCVSCKVTKPTDQFYPNRKKDGYFQSKCKDCGRTASREWSRSNKGRSYWREYDAKKRAERKSWIRSLKEERGCEICGESNGACLDFHHLDQGTKAFTISFAQYSRPERSILAEIAKCQVLCANCHRKQHDNELLEKALSVRAR